MRRTIISLEREDKRWLDSYSRNHHISSAEALRRALRGMRAKESGSSDKVISETAGLWKGRNLDAAKFVSDLRDEWDE